MKFHHVAVGKFLAPQDPVIRVKRRAIGIGILASCILPEIESNIDHIFHPYILKFVIAIIHPIYLIAIVFLR